MTGFVTGLRRQIIGLLCLGCSLFVLLTYQSFPKPHRPVTLPSITPVERLHNPDFTLEGDGPGIAGWTPVASGSGNTYRLLTLPAAAGGGTALEMVAGGTGRLVLTQQVASLASRSLFAFRASFLSTRGAGRIYVKAYDGEGRELATVGWVAVGDMPRPSSRELWFDRRQKTNYRGDWLEERVNLQETVSRLAEVSVDRIRLFQVFLHVEGGQHLLVTGVSLAENPYDNIRVTVPPAPVALDCGGKTVVETLIHNTGAVPLENVVIQAEEPYGFGLVGDPARQRLDRLAPGERRTLTWTVTAQRPSAVNLDRPWRLVFSVYGASGRDTFTAHVRDPRPGKLYYILTDDLEPIDGAGYAEVSGNRNSWLDPEEFQVQLVDKAERLNAIAEAAGARWTHFIAWPVVTAAQWAAEQSGTGAWPQVIRRLEQSVREQSRRGHQYSIHMHTDYDYRITGNILSYDPGTDGFWANHNRHGWAHSLKELGDFEILASRAGSLYYYHTILEELARGSGQGQQVSARTGSFDFGDGPEDEAKSMEAYRRVGLFAGSDAGGNKGGWPAAPYGASLYFSSRQDITKTAEDLTDVGIIQFLPTPNPCIMYDRDPAEVMNAKVAQGVAFFAPDGRVKPGIHAIVGFTHAMFFRGDGDWKSVDGGQFSQIAAHLGHVRDRYVAPGILTFATADAAMKDYMDYYTPTLRAVYGAEQYRGMGVYVYSIRLLGETIPVDAAHRHAVTVKYPLYLRDKAYKIEILKNRRVIARRKALPTPDNDITFVVDDRRAAYSMRVYTHPWLRKLDDFARWLWGV